MSSTASTSITASPTKATITASPSSGIGTATPTTAMTMTTSNSGGLSPLEQEIFALKAQLAAVSAERNVLQETLRNAQGEVLEDCDPSSPLYNNQNQSPAVYEARLTELHSVIAELKKQLDIRREQIIPEESTDFEEDYELDAEDLLSIDENPHLDGDKSMKMNFINARTGKAGIMSLARTNQNLQRGNHHNSNNSTILLTTPSDDEDELESSSGLIDSSPVNNHDNNLPSDVDVDGDYFEDDQIITSEGFGLKCVEIVEINNGHNVSDVIDTEGITTWLDKTRLIDATTADSNNCNIEALQNPINHDYTTPSSRRDNKSVHGIIPKHLPEKSVDFSPISSPESPEDNNAARLLGGKYPAAGTSADEEDEEEEPAVPVAQGNTGQKESEAVLPDIHGDSNNERRDLIGGRSVGMKSSHFQQEGEQQQQHSLAQSQSPQQYRRAVRRHRRNSSSRRNHRDTASLLCQLSAFNSSPCVPPPAATASHSKALEIQNRERSCNGQLKENRHHPSMLHATLSSCKPEKLNGEFSSGGCSGGGVVNGGQGNSPGRLVITSMRTTPSESPSPESKPIQFANLCQEVAQIRQEHDSIKDNLFKKEGELDRTRSALENIAKERDFLKNKVTELEQLLKQSPKRLPHFSPADLSAIPVDEAAPVCKLAERVKLQRHGASNSNSSTSNNPLHQQQQSHYLNKPHQKSESHTKSESPGNAPSHHRLHQQHPSLSNNANDCSPSPEIHRKSSTRHSRSHHKHLLSQYHYSSSHQNNHHSKSHPPIAETHCGLTGADLMLIGPSCSTRVVEHLVQPIKNESALREMQHSLSQNGISPLNEEKIREFEIETERLSSKIEHLRSQNDMLTLNLEDAKGQADRLTVLLGKYESNNVALNLAVGYSDHTIEAYDILVALLESELGQLLANLRATGIGAADKSPTHMIEDVHSNSGGHFGGTVATSGKVISHNSQCPSSSSANAILSTSISSGNNNNSNDNSPTGDHSRTVAQSSTAVPSSSNNRSSNGQPISTPPGTTLFVSTTTTTTTTAAFTQEEMDIGALIERANENRLTAENAARVLLSRFMADSPGSENNNCMMILPPAGDHPNTHHHHGHSRDSGNHHGSPGRQGIPPQPLPWEETSSCSQTLSSASSLGDTSNGSPSKPGSRQGGDLLKNEESRIRDLIITLKTERESVRQTVTEVESWSMESLYPSKPPSPCDILEARKLDLETAVLMQELMAMREERAELRAQLFLLEKEKTSLELRLQSHETQEEAYKARINYLKSEILDYQNSVADPLTQQKLLQSQQQLSPDGNANSGGASSPGNSYNPVERELVLKKRIQELASALEKVTHNSKMREKQNHEMISELKRANGILIETLEAVKKKYQSRIRKMEEQIMAIMERHSMQLKLHKDRIHYLELENQEQKSQQQQQLTAD